MPYFRFSNIRRPTKSSPSSFRIIVIIAIVLLSAIVQFFILQKYQAYLENAEMLQAEQIVE